MTHSFKPEVVEKAARAIAVVASRGGTLCEGEEPGDNWEAWEEEAQAALSIPEIAALYEALEPFAQFADSSVDEEGWSDFGLSNKEDRVVDWFGPNEFRRARKVLTLFRVSNK